MPVPGENPWISILLGGAFTLQRLESASVDLVAPGALMLDLFPLYVDGMPFVEQIIAHLAAGYRRIFVGYPMRSSELNVIVGGRIDHLAPNDWPEMMKGAGFETHSTTDRLPYCTAVGSGTQLARTRWMKGMLIGTPCLLFASNGERTPLEEMIDGWMRSNLNVDQRLGQCADDIYHDPSLLWRLTAGAELFYSAGGEEDWDAILNVRGISVDRIHEVLREAAEMLDLRLYYGGEAPQASEQSPINSAFDPYSYHKWAPLPNEWERVL